jgi:hypothetical protein
MADWDGEWYLVSMLGDRCNWVQNVRAAGGRATLRRGRAVRCQLVEVPPSDRPRIIKRYLEKVPGARPHIPVDLHAPVADYAAIAETYPVFRVVVGDSADVA